MITNNYKEKKCPFKVDASIHANTYYHEHRNVKLNCIGPNCMAWKDISGPNVQFCMRLSQ